MRRKAEHLFDSPRQSTDGPPASYPSVFRGCHWGQCTDVDPLPIRVGDLVVATSTWRTSGPRRGAYNVAYDLWTNSTPTFGIGIPR